MSILSHGANDINLDFADVKTVMSHRGLALMGVGESQGSSAAYDAAKTAIESPLLASAYQLMGRWVYWFTFISIQTILTSMVKV